MPELPEVETVKNTLKELVKNKKIIDTNIIYPNIIEFPNVIDFKNKIKNQTIKDIHRRGKWLMFELNDYYLLSHLRMEGKYLIRHKNDKIEKHEHVIFYLDDMSELRYRDTRKFGRMHLIEKENIYKQKPLNELGLEPFSEQLNSEYLKEKLKTKKLPIKTLLLDQSIIVGIGNIYADEILYLSKINPLKKGNLITKEEIEKIIKNTRNILKEAIKNGGTTIRSYESSEGVHGRFQQNLLVHNKEGKKCKYCNSEIIKIKIGGRGTYYCPICQEN